MSSSSNDIFSVNPYENHHSLTQLQSEVLWEYAKLAYHVKAVSILFQTLSRVDSNLPRLHNERVN